MGGLSSRCSPSCQLLPSHWKSSTCPQYNEQMGNKKIENHVTICIWKYYVHRRSISKIKLILSNMILFRFNCIVEFKEMPSTAQKIMFNCIKFQGRSILFIKKRTPTNSESNRGRRDFYSFHFSVLIVNILKQTNCHVKNMRGVF